MPRYLVKPDVAFQFSLSPREQQVLPLIAEGLSTQEIALFLTVSGETVRSHIAALVRKLSASNRSQLPLRAIEFGVLVQEE